MFSYLIAIGFRIQFPVRIVRHFTSCHFDLGRSRQGFGLFVEQTDTAHMRTGKGKQPKVLKSRLVWEMQKFFHKLTSLLFLLFGRLCAAV